MDSRTACWIQPEQNGPDNSLWMHIWETSQVYRANSCINNQHHRCNFGPHSSASSPGATNVGEFGKKVSITTPGLRVVFGKLAEGERSIRRKGSLSPSSSSLDSEAETSSSPSPIDNLNIAEEANQFLHAFNVNNLRQEQEHLPPTPFRQGS